MKDFEMVHDEFSRTRCLVCIFMYWTAVALGADFQIEKLHASKRDYELTSELYPDPYPNENATWRWNVTSGSWAVLFMDFRVACERTAGQGDRMFVSQIAMTFSCSNKPVKDYFYRVHHPSFRIELYAGGSRQTDRGFKIKVVYADNEGELERKIDDMRIDAYKKHNTSEGGQQETCLLFLIFLVVLVLINIAMVAWVCLLRRHNQRLKTSYTFSIRELRPHLPAGCQAVQDLSPEANETTRLDPSEPAPPPEPEVPSPRRQVQRNNSDASWVMRAQTSVPKVSCGGCGINNNNNNNNNISSRKLRSRNRAASESAVRPLGSTSSTLTLDSDDLDDEGFEPSPAGSSRGDSRLGPLPEERLSRNCSLPTLRTLPPAEHAARSVDNAGYFLMSAAKVEYFNAHQ